MLLEPKKIKFVSFHCSPIYLPWSDGTGYHDISFLWMLSFKPGLSLSCCTLIKSFFSSSSLSGIKVHIHEVKVVQSCPTLCDPMNYTVHGIFQARLLEWVAFPFSRGSSQPRDQTQVSHIAGRSFTSWAARKAYLWLSIFLPTILIPV